MPLFILAIFGGLLIVAMTPYDTFGWILFGFGVILTAFWLLVAVIFLNAFRSEQKRWRGEWGDK